MGQIKNIKLHIVTDIKIMQLINAITVFLLISIVPTSSKSGPICLPTNWSYTWFRSGNTWFTNIKKRVTWAQAVEECKKIEPGRSTLASIETKAEQNDVAQADIDGYWTWTAGIMVAQLKKWYWYKDNGKDFSFKPLNKSFWNKGQPSGDGNCVSLCPKEKGAKRMLNDDLCSSLCPALCELRC